MNTPLTRWRASRSMRSCAWPRRAERRSPAAERVVADGWFRQLDAD
jgi:hypothetical protein